jgi:enoyl-[acyl-carrier-protein] reductase (NADH)
MNISIRFTRPTIELLIRHLEQAYATGNLRLVRRISAFNQYFPEFGILASSVEDALAYFARRVDEIKSLIQVNGIAPGYFIAEMTKALVEDGQFDACVRARAPVNRWGDPSELIGAAVFLASNASSYVNGYILYVDGGMLACV